MTEFDRVAAALAILTAMDDDDLAQNADIAFTTQDDRGVCRALRQSVTEEYQAGHVERRDRHRVAADVGEDLTKRADTLAWFGVISDILDLDTTTEDYDEERVRVTHGGRLADVVDDALRVRFTNAAYTLLTVIEDQVDDQETSHPTDDDTDDTDGV